MKSEKLYEAISDIDEKLIYGAQDIKTAKRKTRIIPIVVSVAAVLAVITALGFNSSFFAENIITPDSTTLTEPEDMTEDSFINPHTAESSKAIKPVALSKASYPELADYPLLGELDPRYDKWRESRRELMKIEVETDNIKDFSKKLLAELLTDKKDENNIVSPLNLYIALGMLAETCDGNSRQQILDVLGEESVETLRDRVNKVWLKNYRDDGAMKSVLANSLWLNDTISYNKSTVSTISDNYFASVYRGTMGSEKYDKLISEWLYENTDKMMKPEVQMTDDTVLSIASTLVFSSKWTDEFQKSQTESGVFHAPAGDKTVSFMNTTRDMYYFWGEKYSAVSLSLNIGGQMWFILPDEGIDADELFSDEQLLDLVTRNDIYSDSYENGKYLKVTMSVPKFDIQSEKDVTEGIKKLGITDVADELLSDFSPLASNPEGIFIDKIDHGVRVKIDEEGVQAAAYTVIRGVGSPMPPDEKVEFILDRPFVFVITLSDNVPLFAGIVNNP